MPSLKKETVEYHVERVREVLALNPRAGKRVIREILAKDRDDPITLDADYILILKKKIEGERTHRFDFPKVEKRLAEMQDRTESVIAQMWRILLNQTMDERARVAAAKIIIEAELKFFDAQMAAGIFERKLGSLEVRHTHELAPEHKALVLNVFANYGIIRNQEPAKLPEPRPSATPAR